MVAREYKRNDNTVKVINIHWEEISTDELVEKLQDTHIEFIRQAKEHYNLSDMDSELLNQCFVERVRTAS